MEKTSKKLAVFSVLLATIITGIGVTYAIFKWTSSNSDVTFNVEGCYITYDAGSNISGASFGPALSKDDTTNVISKEITMTPECSGVTANLTLTVDSIDDGLKEESFIYELYSGSNKVSNGNFKEATSGKVYTILNTKTLTENVTDTYTLYIYIDGNMDNPTTMGGKSFSFTLGASGENALYKEPPASKYIESLDDGSNGDSGSGVYKIEHEAIDASSSSNGRGYLAVTDYRYYGKNPSNYICLDKENKASCPDKELYRIIGSIYEENSKQNLLKVIKATPLTDGTTDKFSYDYKSDGKYTNYWASQTNSSLYSLLNDVWLNGESGIYYNGNTTAITIDFSNYKLTDYAKELINLKSYFSLGGINSNYGDIPPETYWILEKTGNQNMGAYLGVTGTVGLMYPSDYGYASGNTCATSVRLSTYDYFSKCASINWMYDGYQLQWMITSDISNKKSVWYIYSTGVLGSKYAYGSLSVSPVFYLSKDVVISLGDGTIDNPYQISK